MPPAASTERGGTNNLRACQVSYWAHHCGPIRYQVTTWLNEVLKTNLEPVDLFRALPTGRLLCDLANIINKREMDVRTNDRKIALAITAKRKPGGPRKFGTEFDEDEDPTDLSDKTVAVFTVPLHNQFNFLKIKSRKLVDVVCDAKAGPGTPAAKQNVENFLEWTRGLGLVGPDIFRAEDVLLPEYSVEPDSVFLYFYTHYILAVPYTHHF